MATVPKFYDPDSAYRKSLDSAYRGSQDKPKKAQDLQHTLGTNPVGQPEPIQSALPGVPDPHDPIAALAELEKALDDFSAVLAKWVVLANQVEVLAIVTSKARLALLKFNQEHGNG